MAGGPIIKIAGGRENCDRWPGHQGGRVATVSVTCPNLDEGATGPSQLGTGDICTVQTSAST